MVKNEEKEKTILTSAFSAGPGCHGGCGMKLHIKDGKLVHVEGDDDNP